MGTKQLSNKKSHIPARQDQPNSHKSLFCNGLRKAQHRPASRISRGTLINTCSKATYNCKIARFLPIDPSTFLPSSAVGNRLKMSLCHAPIRDLKYLYLGFMADPQLYYYRTR